MISQATTYQKVYRKEDNLQKSLVVKDLWQYPKREEEGKLLCKAIEKKVINVARYYYHKIIQVGSQNNNVNENMQKGLNITKVTNNSARGPITIFNTLEPNMKIQEGQNSLARQKKLSSYLDILPSWPNKHSCLSFLMKDRSKPTESNQVYYCVILNDYRKPFYKASSQITMFFTLKGCIDGYESLYKQTGILQLDISIGNFMINEDNNKLSQQAFFIDFDLAIKKE